MQHEVRLYGPDLPGNGAEATLRIENGFARIDGYGLVLPCELLRLRRVGFSNDGVEVAWEDAKGGWALQVVDARRAQALLSELEHLAPDACASLWLQRRRSAHRARLSWAAIGVILLVPVVALIGFLLMLDPLASWAVQHVTVEQERQLGEESFRSMVRQLTLRDNGESARVVRELGTKLTQGSRYRYEFHVADDSAVNAFALPGGIVVVNTGLIEATRRPEELAGVLAHEVQHVELRHSLRQIAKQLGLLATLNLFAGNIGASLGGRVAEHLLSLKFTRSAEQQADEQAVALLTRVNIDPGGLPSFFSRLASEPAPPSILSSHPASADRQSNLDATIRALGEIHTVPLEYGKWPPPKG